MYKFLVTLLALLFMSGCGGGSNDATTTDGVNSIVVVSCANTNSEVATNDCGDTDTPDYYTCIESGDTLEEQEQNTTVEIITMQDNTQKVCVKSGSALLVR